ncbi:MAG: type II secretion system GspH family protein [Pseudomonadota bacterium]|nr:type II secretion system GspH family protein [Pseudomonadota bacterium]
MRNRQSGFTLTELILVIVLLGILSAVAMSLFARPDTFSALAARDQMIAFSLLAQKRALANSGDSATVSLTLVQTSSRWQLSLLQGSNTLVSDNIDRHGLSLSLNGTQLADGQSSSINYAADAATGNNYQWRISGAESGAFCITSTGFSHAGDCQP